MQAEEGGASNSKGRDSKFRKNFVVTLVVAGKRLKSVERFRDDKKAKVLTQMSWRKFGSQ